MRPAPKRSIQRLRLPLFLAGLSALCFLTAWVTPVYWRAVDKRVVERAGEGTPTLVDQGLRMLQEDKLGVAELFAAAAEELGVDGADMLQLRVEALRREQAELDLWGGFDPFLEQVFPDHERLRQRAVRAIVPMLVGRTEREELLEFLRHSRRTPVQALMGTTRVTGTVKFLPVQSAAGQPLEVTILLTALLMQGEHFSPALRAEIHSLAEQAAEQGRMGDLETVYLDVFSLGKRLGWVQLTEILRLIENRAVLRQVTHILQMAEESLPVVYSAIHWLNSPDAATRFLIEYGEDGLDDLRFALAQGRGGMDVLLAGMKPLYEPKTFPREATPPTPAFVYRFAMDTPGFFFAVKLLSVFAGMALACASLGVLFRSEDAPPRLISLPTHFILQCGLIGAGLSLFYLLFTEPYLADRSESSEFRFHFEMMDRPLSATLETETFLGFTMDQITYLSLLIFFVVQMVVYAICVLKLAEIRRQPVEPDMKMKLLDNEENLFDAGLYVGLGGTVGSLIFLALGVIEPSLMAAYASTLFGIIFVAFFKIFHLRPYRRRLLVENHAL